MKKNNNNNKYLYLLIILFVTFFFKSKNIFAYLPAGDYVVDDEVPNEVTSIKENFREIPTNGWYNFRESKLSHDLGVNDFCWGAKNDGSNSSSIGINNCILSGLQGENTSEDDLVHGEMLDVSSKGATVYLNLYDAGRIDVWMSVNENGNFSNIYSHTEIKPGSSFSYNNQIVIYKNKLKEAAGLSDNYSIKSVDIKPLDYNSLLNLSAKIRPSIISFWNLWRINKYSIEFQKSQETENYIAINYRLSVDALLSYNEVENGGYPYNGKAEYDEDGNPYENENYLNQLRAYHYWIPYYVKIVVEDKDYIDTGYLCTDPKYAYDNPGSCCTQYPETCCEKIAKDEIGFEDWHYQMCCFNGDSYEWPDSELSFYTFKYYSPNYFSKYCNNLKITETCDNDDYFNNNINKCCTENPTDSRCISSSYCSILTYSNKNVCCKLTKYSSNPICNTITSNKCEDSKYFEDHPDECCKSADSSTFEKNTNICCSEVDDTNNNYQSYCTNVENRNDSTDCDKELKGPGNYYSLSQSIDFTGSTGIINEKITLTTGVSSFIDLTDTDKKIKNEAGTGFELNAEITDTITIPRSSNLSYDDVDNWNAMIENVNNYINNMKNENSDARQKAEISLLNIGENDKEIYKFKILNVSSDKNLTLNKTKVCQKKVRYVDGIRITSSNPCKHAYSFPEGTTITLIYKLELPTTYINYYNQSISFEESEDNISAGKQIITSTHQSTGYYYFLIAFNNLGIDKKINSKKTLDELKNINISDIKNDSTIYKCQYEVINVIEEDKTKINESYNGPDYYYRVISLTNPFPNRLAGENWNKNINVTRTRIEEYITDKNIDYNNPMYEVKLDSSMIRALKNYNNTQNSKGGYKNNSLNYIDNTLKAKSNLLSCLAGTNNACDGDMISSGILGQHTTKIILPEDAVREDTLGNLANEDKEGE